MDFFTLYMRYLEEGYSEASARRLAGEQDCDDEYYDEQESWWQ